MSFNVKVKCAQHDRSNFNLRMPHLTTAEFMENNVILSKCVVPTDKFEIEPVFEARCAALSEPSFINTEYHVRGFYVPHSLVWERFDDWINGNTTFINGSQVSNDPPTVNDAFLTRFLIDYGTQPDSSSYTTVAWDSSSALSHKWDFAVVDPSLGYLGCTAYHFTNEGRYWYKLFTSLGYKLNFTLDPSVGDEMNAFPLLSYMRVWVDYFVPSIRKQLSYVNKVLSIFYNSALVSNKFGDVFNGSEITKFYDAMHEMYHCFYPSSYLTSSWQSPTQPLLSNSTTTMAGNTAYNQNFGDIAFSGNFGGSTSVMWDASLFGIEVHSSNNTANNSSHASNPWLQRNMQKIADWLMRSRFVGSEKVLNILSRFGVKPDNPLAHTARLVGSFTQPLLVQDVNAMAAGDGVKLGEYAGKMFTMAQDSKKFNFNCDDYGCIIITSMICPADIIYYQGIDREMLRVKPTQYYQPEFDSVGCEELSMREIMSGFNFPNWESNLNGGIGAGFVPRYSSYKVANATVSGDFIIPTLNDANKYDAYHHFRAMYKYGLWNDNNNTHANVIVPNTGNREDVNRTSYSATPAAVKAQTALLQTAYDKSQFNRIFNVESDSVDHIYTMYYFNINASRPMLSISDSLPLTDMEGSDKMIDTASPVIENNR